MRLDTLLTVPFTGRGISYTCGSLLEGMQSEDFHVALTVPYAKGGPFAFTVKNSIPSLPGRVMSRICPRLVQRLSEDTFTESLHKIRSDFIYLFGETSLKLSRYLFDRNYKVVREKINCAKIVSKTILDAEYDRLGLRVSHNISDRDIIEEEERLSLTQYIFCPNIHVENSLLQYKGICAEQLIPTSYGFSRKRLTPTPTLLPSARVFRRPVFLFVGTVSIRKGAHLLLSAWQGAGIDGTLILAGNIDLEVKAISRSQLEHLGVIHIPYTEDIGSLYRSADVFVFPSLEEGGPQVTYEAAHCGLPGIVSPMGSGRIIRDGVEGFVVDPHDQEAWIAEMRRLASHAELREHLKENAIARAESFHWAAVGKKRREALIERR